jgi:hypothetical protein
MVFIQLAPTMTAKTASGRQANIMPTPSGTITWVVACIGLLPSALPWNSKAPTNSQGLGKASDEETIPNDAAFIKITQSFALYYYTCLSLPPYQVKEYKPDDSPVVPQPTIPPEIANKITKQWSRRINKQQDQRAATTYKLDTVANTTDILPPPCQYVLGVGNDLLHSSMEDSSIPSTMADSACTFGVGTPDNTCWRTGRSSTKQFVLLGRKIKQATEVAEYPFKVWEPAQELYVTPGITQNSLLSTGKFAAANFITIFDKEEVNIYNAKDIIIAVTRGAILQGWWGAAT